MAVLHFFCRQVSELSVVEKIKSVIFFACFLRKIILKKCGKDIFLTKYELPKCLNFLSFKVLSGALVTFGC